MIPDTFHHYKRNKCLKNMLDAADAAVFTVGDSSGWDFSVGNWTDGKHFKAGDVLVFNYDPSLHNVVAVDLNGYNRCSASAKSRTYTSGKDRIMLSKGNHYFICSYPGHCDGGMKIAISAS
ncbi:Basic blue protein [Abeliophyllum distichum]|uniref:Basic blue protein n=1 Tax=Abeliophyllum distichum TaxID=126358 RepID=A0ABD1Q379_9LAMI